MQLKPRRNAGDALRQAFGVFMDGDMSGGYGGWKDAAEGGKVLMHRGPASEMLGLAEGLIGGQGVRASDETGSVGIGPSGLQISKPGKSGWDLSLGPNSASIRKGDLGIDGGWGSGSWNAGVSLGPVRLEGGYGVAPTPMAPVGYQPGSPEPGGWGQVRFELGGKSAPRGIPETLDRVQNGQRGPSAAERELERRITEYRAANPEDWWRAQ